MLKIVLDTNVYISAILFGGKPKEILELIIEGKIQLFISPEILSEISNVIQRKKFGLSIQEASEIIKEIEILSNIVYPAKKHTVIIQDTKDNIIIDCAVQAEADIIVSGDSDLLELEEFIGIKILKPAQFLSKYF